MMWLFSSGNPMSLRSGNTAFCHSALICFDFVKTHGVMCLYTLYLHIHKEKNSICLLNTLYLEHFKPKEERERKRDGGKGRWRRQREKEGRTGKERKERKKKI